VTPIKIRLVDADHERDAIIELRGEIQWNDPRMVAELEFTLTGLVFPVPGEYRFEVTSDGSPIMEGRILMLESGKGNE
jgi:hypothetical protein